MFRYCLPILLFASLAITTVTAQQSSTIHAPTLTPQNSGTTNGLIAVSPVNDRIVWASGRNGTFVVTTDGGNTWRAGVVTGAETLQFRDVQGVSDRVAYLMSIGSNTTDFRIYKTTDGGATWTLQFQNQLASAFYDCMAFWSPDHGLAHSDSVNGVFPDLRTRNGRTWESIANNMPPALPGEGSFASSGTCVATYGGRNAWIATGATSPARILATRDGGDTWSAYDTPLFSGPSAGGLSVAFRDARNGIVGGGDLDPNDTTNADAAVSHDGGRTWTLTSHPPVTGAIFGLAYLQNTTGVGERGRSGGRAYEHVVVVTANDGGAAWTPDEGNTWNTLSGVTGFWAVAFANPHAGWMVGVNGTILKVSF